MSHLLSSKNIDPPTRKPQSPLPDLIQFVLLMGFLAWLLARSGEHIGYNWQWYQVLQYLYTIDEAGFTPGPLIDGLWITIKISAISMILALIIGLITAFLRLSNAPLARMISRLYLETMRNTPLLIQIFFIYFVLGPVLDLDRFPSAILALSLFEGAYVSEILRSGILSINKGQTEAGLSIGLNSYLTYRHIIMPQAIRNILPPLTNQAISLVKDSALVSTIAIYDLTMQAQAIIAETFLFRNLVHHCPDVSFDYCITIICRFFIGKTLADYWQITVCSQLQPFIWRST